MARPVDSSHSVSRSGSWSNCREMVNGCNSGTVDGTAEVLESLCLGTVTRTGAVTLRNTMVPRDGPGRDVTER